jgi:hypothetical protein
MAAPAVKTEPARMTAAWNMARCMESKRESHPRFHGLEPHVHMPAQIIDIRVDSIDLVVEVVETVVGPSGASHRFHSSRLCLEVDTS